MAQTLNQIVQTITNLANAHQQIESVYFGDFPDYLSRGTDNVYPSLYFDLTGGQIQERSLVLNFSLYFFDRMLHEETNETEVLSDMLEVCQDIIAQLRHQNFEFDEGLSATLSFFTEDTPDLLAGVRADITLDLPFLANRCVVPSTYEY
jgi:hypothetical protein